MPPDATLDWEATRARLAACTTETELRARLSSCARALAPALLGSGTAPRAWRTLGLAVVRRELHGVKGLTDRFSRDRIVLVDPREHPLHQRFTVAHELAHLLIADVDRVRLGLDGQREEQICDWFAERLLVPPGDLSRRLGGRRPELEDVLPLANRYAVGVGVMLHALARVLERTSCVMLAASSRGHPLRPQEVELRAFRSRCGDVFVPGDVRLGSLGLERIGRTLLASDRVVAAGHAQHVRLKLWRPGRSGHAVGPARWRALRMRGEVVLVSVDTTFLVHEWTVRGSRPLVA
jgi:hypothetical protein